VCERGNAQHGPNPAGYAATATRWAHRHAQVVTLGETLCFYSFTRRHEGTKGLYSTAETLVFSVFLPSPVRGGMSVENPKEKKQNPVGMALEEIAESPCHPYGIRFFHHSFSTNMTPLPGFTAKLPETLHPGDAVKTLRGSLTGVVLEVYEDGRVRWRSSQGGVLIATAESLIKIQPAKGGSA